MPNDTNHRILIEHLKNEKKTELMPDDLNKQLEQELSKPAEEVDPQRVNELLDLLGEPSPTQQSKEECWQAIQAHTQKKSCTVTVLRRISTVAATLIMIAVVSFGTARAFNWTFLLKLLGPAMETFGIYSTNYPNHEAEESSSHEYTDDFTDFTQVNYTALKDMPTELRGYTIVPGWIPERYSFITGSIYEDDDIAVVSLFFQDVNSYLSISISFHENSENATAYVYEAYNEDQHSMQVQNQSFTYYYNDTGEIRAASTMEQNVHVYIGGSISEHELEQIIANMY